MFGKKVTLLAASILAISLWSCSSDFDAENVQNTSGTPTTPAANTSIIGAGGCVGCHKDFSWSNQTVTDYLASKHVIHSPYINAASGSCLECHDPLADGRSLEPFIDAGDIPMDGLAAVTCETCHGAGGDHPNGASVPDLTPDYNKCGQCHNATVDHHKYHPEADSIVEKVTASPHVTGLQKTEALCAKCHSDEGARLYKNMTGTPSDLETSIPDSTASLTTASPIQCRTCHDPHSLSLLLAADENWAGSAEYNTCTNCHQPTKEEAYHGENGSSGLNTARVIYDTHFDDPTTTNVEGYNLGPDLDGSGKSGKASERLCRDCHDVHAADNSINEQWANSGHGGYIAQIKAAAEAAGTATDAVTAAVETGAWATTHAGDDECLRCHTATGAKNYLETMASGTTYDPAGNDYSHLTGSAKEMLYCWGCHSNNSGDLRNPGAVTLEYTVADAPITLPDLGKSNQCNTCHGGRGNMDSYVLIGNYTTSMTTGPGYGGPTVKNVTAPHYLAASATIFQSQTNVGYEYTGRDYSDEGYYAHKKVGLNEDSPETGSGPCATCHMTAANHNLNVVEKSSDGTITALQTTICVTCHYGKYSSPIFVAESQLGTTQDIWNGVDAAVPTVITQQMIADTTGALEHESEGFHEALTMLEAELLAQKGITYTGSYPYFTVATNWVDEGSFGAAHNLLYLHHEPGAYAHNSYYAKRLIFDSIDWLQDDNLDGTITIDAATYPAAVAWLGDGTTRP